MGVIVHLGRNCISTTMIFRKPKTSELHFGGLFVYPPTHIINLDITDKL